MPKCGVALTRNLARILLPGFGRSRGFGALSLADMAEVVLRQAPDKAIWLGWSLGGLVASQIALTHPERVLALVTVASSPCFSARDEWPGIKPDVLAGFQQQLRSPSAAAKRAHAVFAIVWLSRRSGAAQSGADAG